MKLEFKIPFHVIPKSRPRVVRGCAFMPPKYKACLRDIGWVMIAERNKVEWPKDKSYRVEIDVYVERANWGDVDNLSGTFLDAGNGGVLWQDDRQVVELLVRKHKGGEGGTRVVVETLDKVTGFEPQGG